MRSDSGKRLPLSAVSSWASRTIVADNAAESSAT